MNAPVIHPAVLKRHVATVEAKHPLRVIGVLPRGSAAHVFGDDALDLLAEKHEGLSLLRLAEAECDLSELVGRPVGIVLASGLKGREATAFSQVVSPL